MKLAELTWPEVGTLAGDGVVVLIPTGSLEQHGPHLPLFTDSILATAVAEAVERQLQSTVLLTPTLWLGASGHHLKFPGTLSASFDTYMGAVQDVIQSLIPHRFRKFFIVNGHGGNSEPNGVALRGLKAKFPEVLLGHSGYYTFADKVSAETMTGPLKGIRHACEAEASLMLHVRPDLVQLDKLRDDGLEAEPPVTGMIHHFDEITEQGSFGYATYATAEKGKVLFDTAVEGLTRNIVALSEGYVFRGA